LAGIALPDYREAVKQPRSVMLLRALAKKDEASFSELKKETGINDAVLYHHLNRLIRFGVIKSEVKGSYRLVYRTPFCYIFGDTEREKVSYFGLLGRRAAHEEAETQVALRALKDEGIEPELVYVLTSFDALKDWEEDRLPYQWILCYEDEIVDVDSVKEKVRRQLESCMMQGMVVIDCTSATKPATIAYYELAQEYMAPLIYVYEDGRSIKWLISKDTLKRKLGIG
jgi:DNA-binding transcriptional ArsR family regulator